MSIPWKDIQILDNATYKTATIDDSGTIRIHGGQHGHYSPQESEQMAILLERQQVRLSTRGNPRELARHVSVYTPSDAHNILKAPPYLGMKAYPERWGAITAHPGTLFLCGEMFKQSLYGGLTDNGCEFVLVPDEMMTIYYWEVLVRLAAERLGRWEDIPDIYQIAKLVQDESLHHNPPVHPSKMITLTDSAIHQTCYWRGVAGEYPISHNVDPHDVRACRS